MGVGGGSWVRGRAGAAPRLESGDDGKEATGGRIGTYKWEHVADGQGGLLATVDELPGVGALGSQEGHLLELVPVRVAEVDPGERGATAGIVDDCIVKAGRHGKAKSGGEKREPRHPTGGHSELAGCGGHDAGRGSSGRPGHLFGLARPHGRQRSDRDHIRWEWPYPFSSRYLLVLRYAHSPHSPPHTHTLSPPPLARRECRRTACWGGRRSCPALHGQRSGVEGGASSMTITFVSGNYRRG